MLSQSITLPENTMSLSSRILTRKSFSSNSHFNFSSKNKLMSKLSFVRKHLTKFSKQMHFTKKKSWLESYSNLILKFRMMVSSSLHLNLIQRKLSRMNILKIFMNLISRIYRFHRFTIWKCLSSIIGFYKTKTLEFRNLWFGWNEPKRQFCIYLRGKSNKRFTTLLLKSKLNEN